MKRDNYENFTYVRLPVINGIGTHLLGPLGYAGRGYTTTVSIELGSSCSVGLMARADFSEGVVVYSGYTEEQAKEKVSEYLDTRSSKRANKRASTSADESVDAQNLVMLNALLRQGIFTSLQGQLPSRAPISQPNSLPRTVIEIHTPKNTDAFGFNGALFLKDASSPAGGNIMILTGDSGRDLLSQYGLTSNTTCGSVYKDDLVINIKVTTCKHIVVTYKGEAKEAMKVFLQQKNKISLLQLQQDFTDADYTKFGVENTESASPKLG